MIRANDRNNFDSTHFVERTKYNQCGDWRPRMIYNQLVDMGYINADRLSFELFRDSVFLIDGLGYYQIRREISNIVAFLVTTFHLTV